METYDYSKHVAEDLRNELPEWFKWNDINERKSLDELSDSVLDYFKANGAVTGDMVGYYTSKRDSEEHICHNMELFFDAIGEFELDLAEYVKSGAQACDVLIRWYVLERVACDVIREYVTENYPNFKM